MMKTVDFLHRQIIAHNKLIISISHNKQWEMKEETIRLRQY